MGLAETLRRAFPPPHRAGWPFLMAGAVLCLAALVAAHWIGWAVWLAAVAAAFVLACLGFFRDPERVPPPRPGAVLAPADGLVVAVDHAAPPAELGLGQALLPRVGIFLSVLDVHVNRVPADGTVARIAYRAGRFVSASLERAGAENERNAIAIRLADGRSLAVVQIAGLIARRILCGLREGEVVRAGARFGMIRFGSRTDLYLPAGVRPLVVPGQRMIGGETVIAELT
jgi:phosphatidylserine decarboxylase